MENEFVPYDIALALKELGFDGECFLMYYGDGQLMETPDEDGTVYPGDPILPEFENQYMGTGECAAPLCQQVFRWFREKYNVDAWAQPYVQNDRNGDPELPDESYSYFIFQDGLLVKDGVDFLDFEESELECIREMIKHIKNKTT